MLRTFFSGLGVLFAALLVFSASFLGNVAADLYRHSGEHEAVAVEITRELSRTWKLADIEQHYVADARQELLPVLGADLDDLKPLGALLYADNVRVEMRWSRVDWQRMLSPAVAAERLAELINRSVKVSFVGKFAGGLADVTAELKREDGRMKLWRLRIDSREKPQPEEYPGRRVISHA
ncbi:MAG: hypothetical protein K8F92_07870 [Hyphomicrobium sp.]|uniref:hypothetical protein n=1 Tax=Hyphomicrobium sp. TaxID=82 RepID=UPI00132C3602|nr:hypothetical protein [Hyphomicrobium sp.]KAB2940041.1 MAG: hypothetical protein F9K20_14395 [Hyphomicrobium sp.]MBZ0209556.1 hypothetical protein [Hyphomicrobium sp.]